MGNALNDRLWSDYNEMEEFVSSVVVWRVLDFDPSGIRPPTQYEFDYNLRGIIDGSSVSPKYYTGFKVGLDISPPYPTGKPKAWFIGTPIWHPNVHPDGRICYEDRWIPGVGITPAQICTIIGMMIAYQLYGLRHQKPVRTDTIFWQQFEKQCGNFPSDPQVIRVTADTTNLIRFK